MKVTAQPCLQPFPSLVSPLPLLSRESRAVNLTEIEPFTSFECQLANNHWCLKFCYLANIATLKVVSLFYLFLPLFYFALHIIIQKRTAWSIQNWRLSKERNCNNNTNSKARLIRSVSQSSFVQTCLFFWPSFFLGTR